MDDMPPRRSRRPQKTRSGESTFPLIPFLIGVIVLGFVIGAGLSMAGRGGNAPSGPVAAAPSAVVPTESPTFAPATLAPLATPRPLSSSSPASSAPSPATSAPSPASSAPSPRATIGHAPSPRPSPSAYVARVAASPSQPPQTPKPSPARSVATLLAAPVTPAPLHSARASATKSPAPLTTATAAASASAAPATTIDADSDFGRLSANVVRQYLRALGRGDTDSAYGAFGVAPGSGGVSFPEQSAMQQPGQIVDIQSRGNNQSQYVTVDIATPDGKYYATYGVHRTPTGAAVIVTHSIVKQ
jgi:hypothetical protein